MALGASMRVSVAELRAREPAADLPRCKIEKRESHSLPTLDKAQETKLKLLTILTLALDNRVSGSVVSFSLSELAC